MAMKANVVEEASDSLMSLYIEMDEIEKELNQSDPLPFKNLHQKKRKLEVSSLVIYLIFLSTYDTLHHNVPTLCQLICFHFNHRPL